MVCEFLHFYVFTSVVAESQAGEIKPCVGFLGVKLSRMVADPRKSRKFNLAKVKAYTVYITVAAMMVLHDCECMLQ